MKISPEVLGNSTVHRGGNFMRLSFKKRNAKAQY
jgi:hypothetical protein